jgi:hypothetical protein
MNNKYGRRNSACECACVPDCVPDCSAGSGISARIGVGVAAIFISSIGLGLALAPGLIFGAPAMALEKGKTIIAGVLIALSNLWTCTVMTVWCLGSFYVVFARYETGSIWPYLLWAYSTATGPWTYMAMTGGGIARRVRGMCRHDSHDGRHLVQVTAVDR